MGDAAWTTHKHVIGWIVKTLQQHISLADSRLQKFLLDLEEFPPVLRLAFCRQWAWLVGILRNVAPALLGGRALFGHL